MQFSDTTNNQGLIQYAEKKTGLGFAEISGENDRLKEFTLYANNAMSRIWSAIFSVSETWQYDDANQTDLPQATTNLISGQSTYALPTAALTIKRLEIKDESGNFKLIHPISLKEIPHAVDEFYEDDAEPVYYRLVDRTIEIFPAANYNASAGIKIYFDRSSVSFDYTDTTQTPGFASEFHYLVGLWMSYEWKSINLPSESALDKKDFLEGLEDLKLWVKRRLKAKQPRLTVRKRRMI